MSTSLERLRVTTGDGVTVTVYDGVGVQQFRRDGSGEFMLPPGLYRVQLERSGRVKTQLVDLDSATEVSDSGPDLWTPALVRGAATTHEYYTDNAILASSKETCSPLGAGPYDAMFLVFLRRESRDTGPRRLPSEPLTIHDDAGRRVGNVGTTGCRDDQYGYLASSRHATPGLYRLRAHRSRRDLAIAVPRMRVARVFVADDGQVRLDDARVMLPYMGRPYDPDDHVARAFETVLAALGAHKPTFPESVRVLLPDAALHDLSFGIAVAHLLRETEEEEDVFIKVMELLAPYAAEVPDIAILEHYRSKSTQTLKLWSAPLFRASLDLALSELANVAIDPYSPIAQAARAGYDDSVWCTWSNRPWDARWVEPTIDSLLGFEGHDNAATIARTLSLPTSTVENTIAHIDATIPLSSRVRSLEDVRVSGYTIETLIGRGSQGTVFRARRDRDGKSVALKVIPAPDTRTRSALSEADVMQRFDHDAIMKLGARGYLPEGAGGWLELELCAKSVLDLLAEADGPLSLAVASDIILRALDGLEYLHARQYVHCDIKPANLMLRDDGSVVIADLGLAKRFKYTPNASMSRAGGTARFAPPEQLVDLSRAQPASDVWSMAATFYFLLTLDLPREEFAAQTELEAARENPIVPIAERWPDVPEKLARCLDRALARDPDQRPQNARELRRELRAALGVESQTIHQRWAVVIGAQVDDVRGAESDAERMAALLGQRGFQVLLRIRSDANRAGILESLEHIYRMCDSTDAVVIYFAGCGFSVRDPSDLRQTLECVAPTDIYEPEEWRGITSREMSAYLQRLVERTNNVTLILDCGFSSQMARGAATYEAVSRALRHPIDAGLRSHLAELSLATPNARGLASVVRLFACNSGEVAYEYMDSSGAYRGAFTDALIEAITAFDTPDTSWRHIIEYARRLVAGRFSAQRPFLEGPVRRKPFELDEDYDGADARRRIGGSVTGTVANGRVELGEGSLSGVLAGDVYGIMLPLATKYDAHKSLATVRVVEVYATRSIAVGDAPMPSEVSAFLITKHLERRPVAIIAEGVDRVRLEHAIARTGTLEIARQGANDVLATIRIVGEDLTIEDSWGPLYPAMPAGSSIDSAVASVQTLAVARGLRELEGENGVFADEVMVRLVVVRAGLRRYVGDHGCGLGLEDRIDIEVTNRSHRPLFVHVFNVGLRGTISQLTVAPYGERIFGDHAHRLAEDGLQLGWYLGLPMQGIPRMDQAVVIVTAQPVDLRAFETRDFVGRGGSRDVSKSAPKLRELLLQLQDGQARDADGTDEQDGFLVKRLSWLLHPRAAALGGLTFAIDENPTGLAAASSAEAWISPQDYRAALSSHVRSAKVSVRLVDATQSRSGNVRLDALVTTRAGAGYRATTIRLHGEAVSSVLYEGEAGDFLDIVVFASIESGTAAPTLAERFEASDDPALRAALADLQRADSDQPTPWVVAVGASATLASIASRVLATNGTEPTGVYRTSFVARERFGFGRHPTVEEFHVDDVCFAVAIDSDRIAAVGQAPVASPIGAATGEKSQVEAKGDVVFMRTGRMKKRALLVGSQTRGLTGVENDAKRMTELLGARGFECDLRLGSNATRKGILDGYESLIANTSADDSVAFMYTGHGEFCRNIDTGAKPAQFQAIIPFDYDTATDGDYHGITSIELSILMRRLTERSKNVTVILDCCHSSQMSRDGAVRDAVARALPHPSRFELARHLDALDQLYPGMLGRLGPQGNPDAVRLVACAQSESAYEYTNNKGVRTGAFTEALVEVLTEIADTPMTWDLVMGAVRRRVLGRFSSQRPEVEGPSRRQLFSLVDLPETDSVTVTSQAGQYLIDAGAIHSITVGDTYSIVPVSARDTPTARATVVQTRATVSVVTLDGTLPNQPVGIPLERAALKLPVTVIAPPAEQGMIEAAIAKTRTLRTTAADEVGTVARLELNDGRLTITDAYSPLFPPGTYPAGLNATVQNLVNMGAAQRLRELEGEHGITASELEIEWGVVEGGQRRKMPDEGTALGLGDRIYCRVKNTRPRNVFFFIFNVGVRGKVTLLTNYAPAGVKLGLGEEFILGEDAPGQLTGLGLGWPDGLPMSTFPRLDTLLVIATTGPANLSVLETVEIGMRGMGGVPTNGLEQLLAQVQTGNTRDALPNAPIDAYLIKRLTYHLHPRNGRMTSKSFLVDDASTGQAAGRSAAAWQTAASSPPRRIAVRLEQLIINDNHAWFKTDVRIDALVVTRATAPEPGYRPQTLPFARIASGERLPLENSLLFHGDVRDFVDICIWVSRNTENSPSLPQLLAERAQQPEVRDAFAALLTVAGVVAAPWVTAVGAGAVLASIAYDALLEAAGSTIGLFRTSFLESEQFGVGRYPRAGSYRAQDFSFSLVIDPVA